MARRRRNRRRGARGALWFGRRRRYKSRLARARRIERIRGGATIASGFVLVVAAVVGLDLRDDEVDLRGPASATVYVFDTSGSQRDIPPDDRKELLAMRAPRINTEIDRVSKEGGTLILTTFASGAGGIRRLPLDLSESALECEFERCETRRKERAEQAKVDAAKYLDEIYKVRVSGTAVISAGFRQGVTLASGVRLPPEAPRRVLIESDFQTTECPQLKKRASAWPPRQETLKILHECAEAPNLGVLSEVTLAATPYATKPLTLRDINVATDTFLDYCVRLNPNCYRSE